MKKYLFLLMLLICSPAMAADWTLASPLAGDSVSNWPSANLANMTFLDRLLSYYREGLGISYSSASDISVAAGEVTCTNSSTSAHVFRQNNVATSVGWADIDTGSETSSTTYYVYANCDAATTTVTFKLSASATAPTGLTTFRRLGSFYNNANSDIEQIVNDGIGNVGEKQSKSLGVEYQALVDGFVVASCISGGLTNSNCALSVGNASGAESLLQYDTNQYIGSVGGPVRAGQYYRVDANYSNATSGTAYFIPFN